MRLGSDGLKETAESSDLLHVIGLPAQLSLQPHGRCPEHREIRSPRHVRQRVDEGTKVGGIGQVVKRRGQARSRTTNEDLRVGRSVAEGASTPGRVADL
jgi:hypothetical protein